MRITKKTTAAAAVAATAALALAACGGGDGGGTAGGDGDKPAELTVAAWTDIPESLYDAFEEEYGIKVVQNSFPDGASAQQVLRNGLGSGGAGLMDVHLIEGSWWTEMMAVPEDWATLPEVPGRWVDWNVEAATVDGEIKGYGTDIGPTAIAYDSGLLAQAGLPSEPEEFIEFVGGADATWDTFIAAGQQFTEATGKPWIDSWRMAAESAFTKIRPGAFEDPETGNALPLAENTKVKEIFMRFAEAAQAQLSAGVPIGNADWRAGYQSQQWATVVAPAWVTGSIVENAAGIDTWRIAEVFPDGGANVGGSFFAVPATGKNVEWSIKLADFLTSPESAVAIFEGYGAFPSQVEALSSPEVADTENAFFGGQRVGQIYGNLAEAADEFVAGGYRGMNFWGIQTVVIDAIGRVEDGAQTPEQAWDSAVKEFDALGLTTD
jgi:cellobiose transport system substrate-binding protein